MDSLAREAREEEDVSDFEKVVEIGSKAIFNTPHKMAGTFPYMDTADQARSFICALRAAGWAVVPMEATEKMLIAGGDRQASRTYYPSDVWSAMLAAGEVHDE